MPGRHFFFFFFFFFFAVSAFFRMINFELFTKPRASLMYGGVGVMAAIGFYWWWLDETATDEERWEWENAAEAPTLEELDRRGMPMLPPLSYMSPLMLWEKGTGDA